MHLEKIEAIAPASPLQEALLRNIQVDSEDNREHFTCSLTGIRNITAFEQALQQAANRHAALRTSFAWRHVERAKQIVQREASLSLRISDISALSQTQQADLSKEAIRNAAEFDLYKPPLMRLQLFVIDRNVCTLLWSYHRLVLDLVSALSVLKEVLSLCRGLEMGQPAPCRPALQYADFVSVLKQQHESQIESYWREALHSVDPPAYSSRDSQRDGRADVLSDFEQQFVELSVATADRLFRLTREHGLRPGIFLQAAWSVVISSQDAEDTITLGAAVSGRPEEIEGCQSIAGSFSNVLPVKIRIPSSGTVLSWLLKLKAGESELRKYQHCPLSQVRAIIGIPHGASLFEGTVDVDEPPIEEFLQAQPGGVQLDDLRVFARPSAPISLGFTEAPKPAMRLKYDRRSFDLAAIVRLTTQLRAVLESIVAFPDRQVTELSLLTDVERHHILTEWNDVEAESRNGRCAHHLFEDQAARTPDAIAIVFQGQMLSYLELNRRAARLAGYLKSIGTGPDMLIGMSLHRSVEMVIGMLGVLKAGGAFVPIDPAYPLERIAFMIENADVQILLTQEDLADTLPSGIAQVICLDLIWDSISEESEHPPADLADERGLAYAIFTSGSTGNPKAVLIEHAGLRNVIESQSETFDIQPGSHALQFASSSFDASIFEIVLALTHGLTLHMGASEALLPGSALAQFIADNSIDLVTLPPSSLAALPLDKSRTPSTIIVAGEAVSAELARRWSPERRFFNAYGPSEATIWASTALCSGELEKPSIGRPISNVSLYLLDKQMRPVPVGTKGELYIGGVGVARGYHNQPELTSERFLPNPFARIAGARLFKTGDLARYLPDGRIDFIGRVDHQVKVRGYRIELGEIEAAILQHPGVRSTAVVASEDEHGAVRLVAYVAPARHDAVTLAGVDSTLETQDTQGDAGLSINELRSLLKQRLPDHMIPARFVILNSLPVTPNGKVDRRVLPAADASRPELAEALALPRNPIEERLARIWSEVLGVEVIGVNDNFFELGGDSILSIQIVARANQAGMGLAATDIFQHQTIAELAFVAGKKLSIEAYQGMVTGQVSLTPIQKWFFEQGLSDHNHYNQSLMLEAKQEINWRAMDAVVKKLTTHHDALRMSYRRVGEEWQQWNNGPETVSGVVRVDLSEVKAAGLKAEIEEVAEQVQRSLSIEGGPVLRVVGIELGDGGASRVFLVVHHLVVDGVSWRILLEDLRLGYEQAGRGEQVDLGTKTTAYKEWARRLEDYAQREEVSKEASHWEEQVAFREERIDRKRRAWRGAAERERSVVVRLGSNETRELVQETPKAYNSRIDEVLMSGLARAYTEWSGERRIRLNVEGHGREELEKDLDVSRTVGWFTTFYPVTLQVEEGGVRRLVGSIKEQLRRIPNRGMGYGLLKYLTKDKGIAERMKRGAEPKITFNYLGQIDRLAVADSPFAPAAHGSEGAARSHVQKPRDLIEITGKIIDGELQVVWTYSEEAYTRQRIEQLAAGFIQGLLEIISQRRCEEQQVYTASDFPLVEMSPQDLDRLLAGVKPVEDVYSLSPLQKAMLLHSIQNVQGEEVFEQVSCTLDADLNVAAFEQAWQEVVNRHSILRTGFQFETLDEPLQIVYREANLPLRLTDLHGLSAEGQGEQHEALLQADRARGFDLTIAPLMRLAIFKTDGAVYRLTWSHHHLILDGWCLSVVVREVLTVYDAFCQGQSARLGGPARPYRDYIEWLKRQDLSKAETFWRDGLKGIALPTPVNLPPPVRRAQSKEPTYADQHDRVGSDATALLRAIGRKHQLTLGTIVQGAWALLLSHYSGMRDVLFITTVSGRPPDLPEVETIVGPFINTLPVRVQINDELSASSWLKQLQEKQTELHRYEYSPFVQAWSEIPLGLPMADSIFIFENYPVDPSAREQSSNLRVRNLHSPVRTKFPLTISASPGPEVPLGISYDCRRFDKETIVRMIGHFKTVLEGFAFDPGRSIKSMSILTESERLHLLNQMGGEKGDSHSNLSITRVIAAQSERSPDAIAIDFGDHQLSYGELNRRARKLAAYLSTLHIRPGMSAGLCCPPGLDHVVALLGILRAGAVCVTLDPNSDKDDLTVMLQDSAAAVVLARKGFGELARCAARIVHVDSDWSGVAEECGDTEQEASHPQGLAAIAYKIERGLRPSPVFIHHQAIRNELMLMKSVLNNLEERWNVLYSIPLPIDLAGCGMLLLLACNARIHMLAQTETDADEVSALIRERGVTALFCARTVLSALVSGEKIAGWPSLKRVVYDTDITSLNASRRLLSKLDADVYLRHRTSKGAETVAVAVRERETEVGENIGFRPAPGIGICLLNSDLESVPIGIPGELYLCGEGLVGRSLSGPDDFENLRPNPLSEEFGSVLYRTGIVGRYLEDQRVEFLGGIEHQVNLRGCRLNLGEIESVLSRRPDVGEAVACVERDAEGDQQLIVYVLPVEEESPQPAELHSFLRERLPVHASPSRFVSVRSIPRKVGFEVDREALANLSPERYAVRESAGGPIAEILSCIWAETFGIQQIDLDSNFFELGGHSLLATQLISRIREAFKIDIRLSVLFATLTIERLADHIESEMRARRPLQIPQIHRTLRGGQMPLSFAQQRLWVIDQLEPGRPFYNCPVALRFIGPLNLSALGHALTEIVRRHESLRTIFPNVHGRPVQRILEAQPVNIPLIDVSGLDEPDVEALKLAQEEGVIPFDLALGPLLRSTLLRVGEDSHVILFTMHHIISDGWSMGVLVREFASIYDDFSNSRPSRLPELTIQYADFAQWQRQYMAGNVLDADLDYWKRQLSGRLPVLELPTDRPRPSEPGYRGSVHTFTFPRALSESINKLSRREGVTLYMTLLAAFTTLLYQYTGQDDIMIGTAIANRNRAELEGLIGYFVNMLLLRTDLSGRPTFRELLGRVREVALGAYAHQDLPFERIVEELNPERNQNHTPLFRVAFGLQNAPNAGLEMANLTISSVPTQQEAVRFDLTVWLSESQEGLAGGWTYSTDLFDAETIKLMSQRYEALLGAIVADPDASVDSLETLTQEERRERVMEEEARAQSQYERFTQIKPQTLRIGPG